jgi:tRNA pseudouridine55 synthase
LLIDKPEGPSSHDVVAEVRREFGLKRVGHTGTLDPFATGLLLICLGWATRLVEYFHVLPKTYEAAILLGEARDTDDHTGAVVATSDAWRSVSRESFEATLRSFLGVSEQRPPDYSARRSAGRRGYHAARAGETVVLESRPIVVSEARLLHWDPPCAEVRLTVSTGTYIRAIARDLGEHLCCHAHLRALRRTHIGRFDVSEATAANELAEAGPTPVTPLEAVGWMRRRELSEQEMAAIRVGQSIQAGRLSPAPHPVTGVDTELGPTALHVDGALVAIARLEGDVLKPAKVFHDA